MTVMQLKAEVVLAVQLATRHRTVKLVSILGAMVLVAGWLDRSNVVGKYASSVFLVPGAIAVVAASRAFAPGPAVSSAGRAASAWWVAPVGRLIGVALIATATASVAVTTLMSGKAASTYLLMVVSGQCVALSGVVMIMAPIWGASASGAVGLLLTLLGPMPPSGVAALLPDGGVLERISVMLWNVLPLAWRGMRAMDGALPNDGVLLVVWMAVSVFGAGWATVPSAVWTDRGARIK